MVVGNINLNPSENIVGKQQGQAISMLGARASNISSRFFSASHREENPKAVATQDEGSDMSPPR